MLFSAASEQVLHCLNPIAPRKAKIVYNFGLSECNRVYMPKRLSGLKSVKAKNALTILACLKKQSEKALQCLPTLLLKTY